MRRRFVIGITDDILAERPGFDAELADYFVSLFRSGKWWRLKGCIEGFVIE